MKKTNQPKEKEIYTEARVAISKGLKEGRTILIPGIGYAQEKEAMRVSLKLRTYFISVYEDVNGRLKHYGYAILK